MNRLLLRSRPQGEDTTRVEIFFQFVQYLRIPMEFSRLTVREEIPDSILDQECRIILDKVTGCKMYTLLGHVGVIGKIVAADCMFGEDFAPVGAESMFPMMT